MVFVGYNERSIELSADEQFSESFSCLKTKDYGTYYERLIALRELYIFIEKIDKINLCNSCIEDLKESNVIGKKEMILLETDGRNRANRIIERIFEIYSSQR